MRPIDADELKNVISDTWVLDRIDEQPTVDAVPVRHGKWVSMSDADGVYYACSVCGEDIPRIAHFDRQFDLSPRLESIDKTMYCPHCGARMDGE